MVRLSVWLQALVVTALAMASVVIDGGGGLGDCGCGGGNNSDRTTS